MASESEEENSFDLEIETTAEERQSSTATDRSGETRVEETIDKRRRREEEEDSIDELLPVTPATAASQRQRGATGMSQKNSKVKAPKKKVPKKKKSPQKTKKAPKSAAKKKSLSVKKKSSISRTVKGIGSYLAKLKKALRSI